MLEKLFKLKEKGANVKTEIVEGIIFILLSLTNVRQVIFDAIPM